MPNLILQRANDKKILVLFGSLDKMSHALPNKKTYEINQWSYVDVTTDWPMGGVEVILQVYFTNWYL